MLYAAQNEKAWSLISDLSEMTSVISAASRQKEKGSHTEVKKKLEMSSIDLWIDSESLEIKIQDSIVNWFVHSPLICYICFSW